MTVNETLHRELRQTPLLSKVSPATLRCVAQYEEVFFRDASPLAREKTLKFFTFQLFLEEFGINLWFTNGWMKITVYTSEI